MKEQSHKDEMSAALRGDFRRLRERGVATTLSPDESHAPAEPDEHAETDAVSVSETAAAVPAEPEPEAEPAPEPQQGWLGRLLGR